MSDKETWKQTGLGLGHAFRDLGKTIINSGKKGVDHAVDWANGDTPPEVQPAPHPAPQPAPAFDPSKLVADEIKKLAALRDQGILTDEEFTEQKRRLLGF
jgi:hypothetical protein